MNNKPFNPLIEAIGSKTVIDTLAPYLTDARKNRIKTVIANRLSSIELAIESPADINNALACVRSCEAFGITRIHIIAPESEPLHEHSITQGAIYWTTIHYHDNLAAFLKFQKNNFLLAGGLPTGDTLVSEVPIDKPLCLIIGNEQRGLSQQMKENCEIHYRVPMYGMSESLNLSVSAGISLYDTTMRKRQLLKNTLDLSEKESKILTAQYYLNSVEKRLIKALFRQ